MKYYDTIQRKFSLKTFFTGILSVFSFALFAQIGTYSPYSGFGIGDLQQTTSASALGRGGVSSGWLDAFQINPANPASYSFLHNTTFQLEGFARVMNLSNSSQTRQFITSGLDNVNLVFKKRRSLNSFSIGLRKYSSVGYEEVDSISTPDYDVNYFYQGKGGVNVFHTGYARVFQIKNFHGLLEHSPDLDSMDREKLYLVRHQISIGGNLDWYFGNMHHSRKTDFADNSILEMVDAKDIQVNDYNFSFGIQGKFNLYHRGILKHERERNKLSLYSVGISWVMKSKILKFHHQTRIELLLGVADQKLVQRYDYNMLMSKSAIGSGGFLGRGFNNGPMTRYNFVPEQGTDFIFTSIAEEWGFLGAFLVIILFVMLIIRIIQIAERQKSAFSRVYAYSVAGILFMHMLINIGMVIGLAPVIGIPLPFISYGGSALLSFSIMIAILIRLDAERYVKIGA